MIQKRKLASHVMKAVKLVLIKEKAHVLSVSLKKLKLSKQQMQL